MTDSATSELRTRAVYDALRADLLESRIRPGERLKFLDLAERFGHSQTVVREALARLCGEGLVISNPKRGFAVMTLTTADLLDLTNLRLRIEVGALRDSIEKGDLGWEREVVATHHMLERTPSLTEAPEAASAWRQRHRDFHRALCAGCESPRLQKLSTQLRDAAELYRIWSRPPNFEADRDVAEEHKAIMEAALRRDAGAADLLSRHIRQTTEDLLAHAQSTNAI